MVEKPLSPGDRQTLDFIVWFSAKMGYPPSVREMCVNAGILGNAIMGRLERLERKGFIRRMPGQPRSVVATRKRRSRTPTEESA